MDASYTVIIARNVKDLEIAALRDVLAKIHKKEVTWESIAKTTGPPLETEKKEPAPKKKDENPDPDPTKDSAGTSQSKDSKDSTEDEIDPESPKGRFIAGVAGHYKGGGQAILDQAVQFIEAFAKNVKKEVDFVYATALKQWPKFVGDFEEWRISQGVTTAGGDPDPGKQDGKSKPKRKRVEDFDPGNYDDWKGLRNKDNFEKFIMLNKDYFEIPENVEMYFKAKEKWVRTFGKEREFPYPQLMNGAAAGDGQEEEIEDNQPGEDDPPAVGPDGEPTTTTDQSEVLLGLFPPKRVEGNGGGSQLLGIRGALANAEREWPEICEEVQQEIGITLYSIQMMRDGDASYGAAYEYLARVLEKGLPAGLDPAPLKEKVFEDDFSQM